MSSVLTSILIGAAAKVGAPIVKGILEKHLGGTAGDIAGTVIDAIAGHAGVTPDQLQDVREKDLQQAIAETEAETPELVLAYVQSQREANKLMLAEMDKNEAPWTWAWRPAGMWMFLGLTIWYAIVVPLLNLVLGLFGASERMGLIVEVSVFVTLFITYTGLYMGGHTVKESMKSLKEGPQ